MLIGLYLLSSLPEGDGYFGVVACIIRSTLSISTVYCLSPFFVGWGKALGEMK